MTTLEQILALLSKYTLNGTFQTNNKTKLSDIFKSIPEDLKNYGVYVFTEMDKNINQEYIVYIGKNGTINSNGRFGDHTLNKRIMQGEKKSKWLSSNNYKVYWYVTIKKSYDMVSSYNIPSVVECELLRKYYDLENKLPKHNNAF